MLHNLGTKSYVQSLLAPAARTSSANGTGFDLQGSNDAEGEAIIILDSAAGTGTSPTLNVKLQDSADNSTFADVTDATFAQVTTTASTTKISVNTNDLRRYVRAVATIAGTTPSFTCAVSMVYSKKYGN